MSIEFFVTSASVLGIAWGGYLIYSVLKEQEGEEAAKEISRAIRDGAAAYLRRQYVTLTLVAVPLAVVIALVFSTSTALGFLLGGFLSALSGFIGMNVAVRANVRVRKPARR